MDLVNWRIPMTWSRCRALLQSLQREHPQACRLETIGYSPGGRSVDALYLGQGDRRVLYAAAHHGNEWLTATLLVTFAQWALTGSHHLNATLCLVPMVDPDGVDLVTGAIEPDSAEYGMARSLSARYPQIPFPQGWKANLRGVDLNLNYPAGWRRAREIKFSQGYTQPGPRDYVGRYPLDQPESQALAGLTMAFDPHLVLAYHSQGREIYWQFADFVIPGARELGEEFAALSGYRLAEPPENSSYAGFKDWFIQDFQRPGYTIEVGQGSNPLPTEQFPQIWEENLPILRKAAEG